MGLGKAGYDLLDFAHWDNIYMSASKNLRIQEGQEGLTIKSVPEKKVEPNPYAGMFVKSTKGEMLVSEADESKLFERCGGSTLRIFTQDGKTKRLEDCEAKSGQYDALSDYFTPEDRVKLTEEVSEKNKKKRKREEPKDKERKKRKHKHKKEKSKKESSKKSKKAAQQWKL